MKTFRTISLLLAALFPLSLCAAETVKVSGTVVDAQGKPVAGAEVDYYQFPNNPFMMAPPEVEASQRATTDNTGAYTLSVSPGPANIVASKAGLAPAWKTLQSTPTAPIQPMALSSSTFLAGTVVDETDHPLADAEVSVYVAMDRSGVNAGGQINLLFGKVAGKLFSARTSADGHFRIEGFPTGAQAAMDVKIAGRALRPVNIMNVLQLPVHAGQEDIKLVTDPAGSVEGKVVVRDSGAPLPGVRVQLRPSNNQGWLSSAPDAVQSGADGSFRIQGVAAGSYQVVGSFTNEPTPLWVSENVPVAVASGKTTRDVKVPAFKGGTVEVSVVGKNDKKGMSGMNVSVYSEGYQQSAMTGADGVAHFRLPPGEFTVYASRQGASQSQEQATVTDGETSRVTLEIEPPSKIAGTVRDPSGAPVANTSIGVFPYYGGEAQDIKTDASGHYELTWEKPQWAMQQNQSFYMVARNPERKLAALHEIQDNTTKLDLDLKPSMSISGRIQDAKGNPITNANVSVLLQTETMGFMVTRQQIPVDGQGKVVVDGLPMGERYGLWANAQGYGNLNQTMDSADPKADHYDFAPSVLKLADRKLAGRVLGTDGKPAAGVNVWMNGEGQPNGNATTDADGRFSFAACEGPVNLNANGQGFNGSTDAMGGDTNVVIRFDVNRRAYNGMNSLTVSGTVYDASGRPAPNAQVLVTPAWGMADNEVTDADGNYKISWQDQPGMRNIKYYVIARDADRNLAGMEPIDTKKTNASVRMEPGLSITGTVLDASGAPLPRANVNLNIMAGNYGGMVDRRPTKVDSDGKFTISALPVGQQYSLFISSSGYGSANRRITKAQSQTNSIELTPFKLRTADREIAGQVLGKDGKALAGAWVNIYGNNQPSENKRTDNEGHFKFKVCSGAVYVSANSPNGGAQYSYGQTEARGGDMNVVVKMGDTGQRGRGPARANPLKPQPWTLAALIAWPVGHKIAVVVLLAGQAMLLLGAVGAVFWMTRKQKA